MPGNLGKAAADGGAAHKVGVAIQTYQAARSQFVSTMEDFLKVKDGGATMDALVANDVLYLLTCPLVKDPVMGIQIASLTTLGELGRLNQQASHEICACGILDEMVQSLSHENRHIRCAANTSLQHVAHHDRGCAQAILDTGVLEPVRKQLETLDARVKETAVKTLNVMVEKGPDFADITADDGTIDTCVSHLRMTEEKAPQTMKTAICQLLSDTANHNEEMARRVVACGTLPVVASLLTARSTQSPLRASALKMYSQVAKHAADLAEAVVQQQVMPAILQALTDEDHSPTRRCAAAVIQQVSRRTLELAEVVAADGGCTCLVQNLKLGGAGPESLAALLAIGHIASFSPRIAKQLLDSDVSTQLIAAMECPDPEVKGAAGWTIEQIASHGPVSAAHLAGDGVLVALEPAYNMLPDGDTKTKLKAAVKAVVKECKSNQHLEPLVKPDTPPDIMRHILAEFAAMLPNDVNMRRSFVTSGALMHMQTLDNMAGLDDRSKAHMADINALFPADVVNYYRK